jgi:hypothetical protein
MPRSAVALVLAALWMSTPAAQQPRPTAPETRTPHATWYKGNVHTHTIVTDGDSAPDQVVRWYREQKYHFLVISDHNTLVNVDSLNATYGTGELVGTERRTDVPFNPFLLIRGEEVTDRFSPATEAAAPGQRDLAAKEIHLGALNITKAVAPQGGASVTETIQRNVDAIRAAGGLPIINHPNFTWAINADDLKPIKNGGLFEVYNAHGQSNNLGGGGWPSVEETWDQVLSSGALLYGIAADDAHAFQRPGLPNPTSAPGRGWIMVRAAQFTAVAIVAAIERGDFYATTGVELVDYRADAVAVTLTVKAASRSKYRVLFIGQGGKVLKDVPLDPVITARTGVLNPTVPPAIYQFRGDEGYVRAKVIESNGQMAWTQPVRVAK